MADQGKWFKLWIGARRDATLATLSKEDFANWCLLGMYLKEQGVEGMTSHAAPAVALQKAMEIYNYEELINVLKKFPNCVIEEKQNFTVSTVTIVNVTWKNWQKYQGDFSSERVRKYRQRETIKKRREEKRREEKKIGMHFTPPKIEEITAFAVSEKLPLDARKFFDFYESKGWLVGRSKMKDWRAAARRAAREWANVNGDSQKGKPTWM